MQEINLDNVFSPVERRLSGNLPSTKCVDKTMKMEKVQK